MEGDMEMVGRLDLSEREMLEIQHSLYYAEFLAHGATGHLSLMLIAKLARHIGFALEPNGVSTPPGTVVPPKLQ